MGQARVCGLDCHRLLTGVPARMSIGPREVHVWTAFDHGRCGEHGDTYCAAALSEDERARASRFARPRDRARYRFSHVLLRSLLARYAGCPPDAVRYRWNEYGKPALAADPSIEFNLSASGDCTAFVVTRDARVGVDVEPVRCVDGARDVAEHFFSEPERAAIAAAGVDARDERFIGIWTGKEACTKALGAGLSMPLDTFSVTLPPTGTGRGRLSGLPGEWALEYLPPLHGYRVAVVVEAADPVFRTATLGVPRLIG